MMPKLSITKRPLFLTVLALTAVTGAISPVASALGDTIIIGAAADATLFQATDGLLASGSGSFLFAGNLASGLTRRAVLRFDVAAALPAGFVIDSVSLQMAMTRTVSGNSLMSLHRVSASWGEGLSDGGFGGAGTAAQANDATWAHRFSDGSGTPAPGGGVLWNNLGGDFDSETLAMAIVGTVGTYVWSSAALTAAAADWLANPANNFGMILLGDEETARSAKQFGSRENIEPTFRPTLTINYTVPGPGAMGLLVMGGAVMFRRRR